MELRTHTSVSSPAEQFQDLTRAFSQRFQTDAIAEFKRCDSLGAGYLTKAQVLNMLPELGLIQEDSRTTFLKYFKFSSDGTITLDEFTAGYARKAERSSAIENHLGTLRESMVLEFAEISDTDAHLIIGDGSGLMDPTNIYSEVWEFAVTMVLLSTVITTPLTMVSLYFGWDVEAQDM